MLTESPELGKRLGYAPHILPADGSMMGPEKQAIQGARNRIYRAFPVFQQPNTIQELLDGAASVYYDSVSYPVFSYHFLPSDGHNAKIATRVSLELTQNRRKQQLWQLSVLLSTPDTASPRSNGILCVWEGEGHESTYALKIRPLQGNDTLIIPQNVGNRPLQEIDRLHLYGFDEKGFVIIQFEDGMGLKENGLDTLVIPHILPPPETYQKISDIPRKS